MNKQLSVMGLAARASMVPVLITSGLTALAAALFIRSQWRGRLNLWPVATTIVTLYTFTIRLSDGTWMIFLLAALAMAGCTLALLLTGGERREV